MFTREDVDQMIEKLEERLPIWTAIATAAQFQLLLSAASDYICRGTAGEVREYALTRLGILVPDSGRDAWRRRYRKPYKPADDLAS